VVVAGVVDSRAAADSCWQMAGRCCAVRQDAQIVLGSCSGPDVLVCIFGI